MLCSQYQIGIALSFFSLLCSHQWFSTLFIRKQCPSRITLFSFPVCIPQTRLLDRSFHIKVELLCICSHSFVPTRVIIIFQKISIPNREALCFFFFFFHFFFPPGLFDFFLPKNSNTKIKLQCYFSHSIVSTRVVRLLP